MATKRWTGNAPKIAQVTGWTFGGTWEATDVINLTIGTKTVSVVAGSTVTNTVVDTLVAAWNALTQAAYPEFYEMTAARSSSDFRLTARTAGKPFGVTIETTETGGGAADAQTIDGAASSVGVAVTANSGPNVVSLAANWEGGVAPVDADDIVFDHGNVDVLYDLDQNGVTPTSITQGPGYTGRWGLPVVNKDSAANPYFEYRETYLKYGTSGDATNIAVTITGGGNRMKYSAGSSQATFNIRNTGQREDANVPCCLLKSTHADTALHVSKGDVGFAFFGGEVGTIKTLNVGYQTNIAGDAQVILGSGVTLTAPTIVQTGGTLETNSAITGASSVVIYDGVYTHQGAGGIAAGLAARGGEIIYNSTGTLGGAPVVSDGGLLSFDQDLRAKTVTNPIDVYGEKSRLYDNNKVVATLVYDLDETANSENIQVGRNARYTRGAVA